MIDETTKSYKKKVREKITSYLVTVAFLFNSICLLVNILVPTVSDFGTILVVAILFVGSWVSLSTPKRIDAKLFLKNLFLLFIIILSYVYYNFSPIISTLMINFFVWGIGITIIMMMEYDYKKTINSIFVLSTIIMVFELVTNAQDMYEPMVWTYAIFPCLVSMIVHYTYCQYSEKWKKLLYIPGIIMIIKFILNANRGGTVSLVLLIYLVSIKSMNVKNGKMKNKKLMNAILLVFLGCSILFYEQIIMYLYEVFSSWNIEVSAINKMYRMIKMDDITNSRSELYVYAWKGFLGSPLWGNGVGGFSVNHGGWTHNFILQILYEGGIVLFLLIMKPLVKIIKIFVKGKFVTKEEYSLFVLFFCTSIPKLLFSTELWNTQGFWMLIAFGVITMKKHEKRRK